MKRPCRDLLARPAERLVICGYRNMMAAYELGDGACWEEIWRSFTHELGSRDARRTVGEVQYWVRTLRANSGRALAFYPNRSLQLCEDECIALSLVASAQTGDFDAGCCAATILIGTEEAPRISEVWQASSHLAAALRCSGQVMHACPRSVIRMLSMAPALASLPPAGEAGLSEARRAREEAAGGGDRSCRQLDHADQPARGAS